MPVRATFEEAADALKRGQAVVFPTDTVYGLGVSIRATSRPRCALRAEGARPRQAHRLARWLAG